MKHVIISIFLIFSIASEAYAGCQWFYINALSKDIKHASQLLSSYAVCRNRCKTLETNLVSSIAKMSNDMGCGAHILTSKNREMMDFIASRFKLIQKQKTGEAWTEGVPAKPVAVPVKQVINLVKPSVSAVIAKPVQTEANGTNIAQTSTLSRIEKTPKAVKQTRITLPRKAYVELWTDTVTIRQQSHQKTVIRKQRLIQHRKHVLIQQQKVRRVKAKKLAMQHHVNQQRFQRQRLLKRRELARHLNRQKVRQQRLVRAQRNRAR